MSESMGVKTLIIDGQELSARAGQTILEVARENEINIPTLCHLEGLSNVGACRLCLVEIKGSNKLLPACVANIHEGMEVVTNSERLKKHRRVILELTVDASHERFTADHNRCILCMRCVRACAEIEGAHIWDVMGRGIDSIVITDLHDDWGSSACTRCGKCVQCCPTGALFDKSKIGSDHPKYPDFLPYLNLMREAR